MLITTINCIVSVLAIAILSVSLDGRYQWRELFCVWGIAFVTDMLFFGTLESCSLPAIVISLTIYKILIHKEKPITALFINSSTIICAIACVLFCSSPFMLFFPAFVGTVMYDITIGILQLLAASVLAFSLRNFRIETFQAGKTMYKVTAAQVVFLVLYTLVMPLLLFIPGIEMKTFMLVYSIFSLFIIGIAVYFITFLHSAFKNEREYTRAADKLQAQKDEMERMKKFWNKAVVNDHTLMGLYQSMGRFIYNKDFDGLQDYFSEYILPTVHGTVSGKISNLQNVCSPLIQNLLDAKYRLAKSLDINMYVEIIGSIEPKIAEYDLFQVMNIYIDNAIHACSEQEADNKVAVILSNQRNAVHILIKNMVADNLSLAELLSRSQQANEVWAQHGNGMSIAEKVLGQYDNVIKQITLENGVFAVKIIIGENES